MTALWVEVYHPYFIDKDRGSEAGCDLAMIIVMKRESWNSDPVLVTLKMSFCFSLQRKRVCFLLFSGTGRSYFLEVAGKEQAWPLQPGNLLQALNNFREEEGGVAPPELSSLNSS
jgi:hypothetical protein